MPYGLDNQQFLTLVLSCVLAMFSGSQVVYKIFEPLSDLDQYLKREMEAFEPDFRVKLEAELKKKGFIKD